jgi:hypothetical protein
MAKTQISIVFSDEQLAEVRKRAAAENRSTSNYVRNAVLKEMRGSECGK